uniref:Uncharacterized protein n=1 Tax=Anguilla anguilla TaxID=7936 RepID=A0A0E9P8A2_ANGAN
MRPFHLSSVASDKKNLSSARCSKNGILLSSIDFVDVIGAALLLVRHQLQRVGRSSSNWKEVGLILGLLDVEESLSEAPRPRLLWTSCLIFHRRCLYNLYPSIQYVIHLFLVGVVGAGVYPSMH